MTYAQYINTLLACYKLKASETRKMLAGGFSDGDEIIRYLHAERDTELAKLEYFQFFNQCVKLNLDLDNEI